MEYYQKALNFASNALQGKRNEDGSPYINHAIRVANQMTTDLEKTVAILHDVLEDTELRSYDLADAGFPEEIVEDVLQLTRKNSMTYFDYIEDVATNAVTARVKLAELKDNMDVFRVKKLSFQTYPLEVRAKKATEILKNSSVLL